MRRYALVLVVMALTVGLAWAADTGGRAGTGKPDTKTTKTTETPKSTVKTNEVQGTVTSVDVARGEQGWVFTVTVRSTAGNSVTCYARPKNGQIYSRVGELKMGDKVRITWTTDTGSEKKWITQLQIEPKDTTTTKTK